MIIRTVRYILCRNEEGVGLDHGTNCRMNGDIREIGFRRRGEKAKKNVV
jgi:hypothetical protein